MKKPLIFLIVLLSLCLFGCEATNKNTNDYEKFDDIGISYLDNLCLVEVIDRTPSEKFYDKNGEIVNYIDVNIKTRYHIINHPEMYSWEYNSVYNVTKKKTIKHLIIDDEYKQFFDTYDNFIFQYSTEKVYRKTIINGEEDYSDSFNMPCVYYHTLLAVENDKIIVDDNYTSKLTFYNRYKSVYPKLASGLELSEFIYWLKTLSITKRNNENIDPEYDK